MERTRQRAYVISGLKATRQEIERDREVLRVKMAQVEGKLIQLTSQQAELQKIQVALDSLLTFLEANPGDGQVASRDDSHSPSTAEKLRG